MLLRLQSVTDGQTVAWGDRSNVSPDAMSRLRPITQLDRMVTVERTETH